MGPNTDWLSRTSGDSLFEAIAANGKSVFLTDNLFEFGTNLNSYKAIFVVLGVWPYSHFLAASAPEGPVLTMYLLGGGRIYLEGGDCFNYDPDNGGYNIRPWFNLNPGSDGTSDVFGIVGRDTLSRFSFQYAGLNITMDVLQPITSTVIWQNNSNSNVCGVYNPNYGTGRSIGVVPSFGGLVDNGMQFTTPMRAEREMFVGKKASRSRAMGPGLEKKEFVKKFAYRPEMRRKDSRQLLRFTPEGISMLANTKRDLMAAYLILLRGIEPGVDEHHDSSVPLTYSLHQNYPNPFNPSTMINYQLPMSNWVTLKVFDMLGREVATLVNEFKQSGSYTVRWDGSNMASGVYFYKLEAGGFVDVKKLVVMK